MTTPPARSILKLKRPSETDAPAVEERLHKVLANAGLGSRRMLEQRIEGGEVQINSIVATLGQSVRSGDRIEMDAKRFVVVADNAELAQVIVYHKPDGVVATREDPEGRPTVFEQLPQIKGARWIAVGRLDINTTGLLLLTTDGNLANTLMHPSSEIEREYICRVHGEVPDEVIEQLRTGIELDDGPAQFDEIAVVSRGNSHSWFRVVLREGRNREVRRMWESQGLMVSRLKRIRYGVIELPRGLQRGQSAELDASEVAVLRQSAGIEKPTARLTLAPVIGQRRTTPTEFRPSPKSQQAWVGARNEEAREFAAFDRIRDDGWRSGAPKSRSPRPGAGAGRGAGAGASPGRGKPPARGGRGAPAQGRAPAPRQGQSRGGPGQGQNRGPARGQAATPNAYSEPGLSPAVLRSWFPDSVGRPRRGARPGEATPYQPGQYQANDSLGNRAPPRNSESHGNVGPRNSESHGNVGPRNSESRGNVGPRNSDAPRGNVGPRNSDGPRGNGPRGPGRASGNAMPNGNVKAPGPNSARPQYTKGPRPAGPRPASPRKPAGAGGAPGNAPRDGNTAGRRGPGGSTPNRGRGGPRTPR